MGDAYSNARKARLEAEEYMESKGWKRNVHQRSSITGWIDPLPPNEEMFFDAAWDIQYERDKAAGECAG